MSRKPAKTAGGWSWRRVRAWLLILCATLVLVPIVQVAWLRFFNPRMTPLMALRWVEGKFSSEYEGGLDQRWLSRERLPEEFLRAVWVSEDARFFQHNGFDWVEVAAAMAKAKKTGLPVRGTSTITQQCARSTFLWTGRSYLRKGLEAYYTWWMEKLLSKQRILEVYANVIEMGDGIYGVEAAAQRHYKIPAAKLTRPQAAMLAALLPYPRGWDPNEPSPRLKWRHKRVLRELAKVPSKKRMMGAQDTQIRWRVSALPPSVAPCCADSCSSPSSSSASPACPPRNSARPGSLRWSISTFPRAWGCRPSSSKTRSSASSGRRPIAG